MGSCGSHVGFTQGSSGDHIGGTQGHVGAKNDQEISGISVKINESRSIFGETPSKSIVNPSFLWLPTSKSPNFLHSESIFDHFPKNCFFYKYGFWLVFHFWSVFRGLGASKSNAACKNISGVLFSDFLDRSEARTAPGNVLNREEENRRGWICTPLPSPTASRASPQCFASLNLT